jgi:hypothetical protein
LPLRPANERSMHVIGGYGCADRIDVSCGEGQSLGLPDAPEHI